MKARRLRRGVLALTWAALSGGAVAASGRPASVPAASPSTEARARYLMGTRLTIVLPASAPEAAFEAAFGEVERLEGVLSNWTERSELSRMNAAASHGAVRCSADLFAVIGAALHWAEETGGAFDPTVEPLVRAYGLRGPEGRIVTGIEGFGMARPWGGRNGAFEDLRAPVGWRHVRLDREGRTVAFDRQGVGIDLGGIGKGFALDAAAGVLTRRGVSSFLLDFGGQILAVGPPPGRPGWPVAIADPLLRGKVVERVEVRDRSVSTSGNSERSVPGEDGPVGHILDPLERKPAPFRGSVTVIAADATAADALSTALFVMGPDRGKAWADRHHVAALYLERSEGRVIERTASAGFDAASRLPGGG
jgi:FAD:protein FMN transferase